MEELRKAEQEEEPGKCLPRGVEVPRWHIQENREKKRAGEPRQEGGGAGERSSESEGKATGPRVGD